MRELHGERCATARHTTQLSDVAEHFRQRHGGHHGDVGSALELLLDHAATAVDVADHITQVVARGHRLDLHDRLEQDRGSLLDAFAEGGLGRDFEGQGVRVDVVVATVREGGLEVHRRIVREHAVFLLHLQSLLDRRNVLTWHRATDGLVFEHEALTPLQRLEGDPHFRELARAAGLLLVDVLFIDLARDGLAVGHLRLAHGAFNTKLGAHAVQGHLEVQLTHAPQNGLARFAIRLQVQRGIGADHLAEGVVEFLQLGFDLRLHRYADDGVREAHALQYNRRVGVAEGVAGVGLGEGDEGDDVTGARLLDRVGFLGEHFDHAADLLALAAGGVLYGHAAGQNARVHTHEGQRTVVVVDDLESERRERLVVRGLTLADRVTVGVDGLDGFDVRGGRQVVDNRVQHLLHALVLIGRAAQDRVELRGDGAFAEALAQHVG